MPDGIKSGQRMHNIADTPKFNDEDAHSPNRTALADKFLSVSNINAQKNVEIPCPDKLS